MAIELSLDTVDELAQENYADIIIPLPGGSAVTLVHPLRMSDEQREDFEAYFSDVRDVVEKSKARAAALEAGEELEDEPEDEAEKADAIEQSSELLNLIAEGQDASALIEALKGDLTKHQAVITFYFETVNPGEA